MAYKKTSPDNPTDSINGVDPSQAVNAWVGKSELSHNAQKFATISEEQECALKQESSSSNKQQELNNQILDGKANQQVRSKKEEPRVPSEPKYPDVTYETNRSKKKTQLSTSASSNTDHISS